MSENWWTKEGLYAHGCSSKARQRKDLSLTEPESARIRCSISESLLVALLQSGSVKAEELRCSDAASAEQLKRIVLVSCRGSGAAQSLPSGDGYHLQGSQKRY